MSQSQSPAKPPMTFLPYLAHPWHGISPGERAPEIVTVFVEMVPTDTVKYEVDKRSGHLKLDRLTVLWDDNHISIDGDTAISFSEDVLKRFAAILRSERRTDDLAARIGGEEFALLLVAASVEQARAVAVKVQKELDRVPWPQIAERLVVTVSAGIACSAEALVGASSETNAGDCADALLAAADRRLYAAKAAGRNRVVMSD